MDPHRRRLEALVRDCGRRAWIVALALLRNRDDALDAVQQAFLVAARKPRKIPADDPWPWFAVVVAHEARNLRRKKRPVTNKLSEGADMQARDLLGSDPGAASEQREANERLHTALAGLPAREREAVVFTQMAGMTHAVAAEALDVPRKTVSAQVSRGLDRLGRDLRREPKAVPGALAVLPIAGPPGGWEAATELWMQSAVSTLASSAAAATGVIGGASLMSKTWIAITLTAALGVGFLGGAWTQGLSSGEPSGTGPDGSLAQMTVDPGRPSSPTLGPASPDASGEVGALRREVKDLREKLTAAESTNTELERRLVVRSQVIGPTFTFGRLGQLDAIREANWGEMAAASNVVHDAIHTIFEHKTRGATAPKDVFLRLQENVEKMRKYEYRTIGKVPTDAKHNGEITHPITMANLMAAILAEAGIPLTEAQIEKINARGVAFEGEFARLRDRFTEATPRVERMLAEYQLKGRFTDEVTAVLTAEQRAKVVDPAMKGLAGLDLHSPTLMILHTSPVIAGDSIEKIAQKLRGVLAHKLQLGEEEAAALDGPLQAWRHDVRGLLAPVPHVRLKHYTYDEGEAAGQATVALTRRLLDELRLSETARASLLDDYAIYVPRVVEHQGG